MDADFPEFPMVWIGSRRLPLPFDSMPTSRWLRLSRVRLRSSKGQEQMDCNQGYRGPNEIADGGPIYLAILLVTITMKSAQASQVIEKVGRSGRI